MMKGLLLSLLIVISFFYQAIAQIPEATELKSAAKETIKISKKNERADSIQNNKAESADSLTKNKVSTSTPVLKEGFIQISPDSNYLARVQKDKAKPKKTKITVFDAAADMRKTAWWYAPVGDVRSVKFSPRDSKSILISGKNSFFLYRMENNQSKLIFSQSLDPNSEIIKTEFSATDNSVIWATKDSIFKTDLNKSKNIKLFQSEKKQDQIKSISPLQENRVAVGKKDSKDIYIYSTDKKQESQLTGHNSPVVTVAYPGGERLISVDKNKELLIWDLPENKVINRVKLDPEQKYSRVAGASLDEKKANLMIVFEKKNHSLVGKKYSLAELDSKEVNPISDNLSLTDSGEVYRKAEKETKEGPPKTDQVTNAAEETKQKLNLNKLAKSLKKKEPTLLERALVEEKAEQYDMALALINQVEYESEDYLEAQKLKKKIFNSIEQQNDLKAAVNQYKKGQLKSAQIMFRQILENNPGNFKAAKYLKLIKEKQRKAFWKKLILFGVFILSLLGTAYLFWANFLKKKQIPLTGKNKTEDKSENKFKQENKTEAKPKTKPISEEHKQGTSTAQFNSHLEKVRALLAAAKKKDLHKRHEYELLRIETNIHKLIKRAKVKGQPLTPLIEKLIAYEEKIQGMNFKKKESQEEAKQEKTKSKPEQKLVDYYKILDIPRWASQPEVKQAYRKKMIEYHPDKHDSSDYDWIKKEANRLTREIQEAYSVLGNLEKRVAYNRKLKKFEEKG